MKKLIYPLYLLMLLGTYSYASIAIYTPNTQAQKVIASIRMPTRFEADFVYTYSPADHQQDNGQYYQVKGKIWIKGPKYRLVWEDQLVISNGKTIWNYVASLQEVQIYHQQTDTTDLDITSFSPIQLLHLYEYGFVPITLQTTMIDQKKSDLVQLIPAASKNNIQHLHLTVDHESHQIRSMQVVANDGTVHELIVENITIHAKLNDLHFEFQMPADPIEVLDWR